MKITTLLLVGIFTAYFSNAQDPLTQTKPAKNIPTFQLQKKINGHFTYCNVDALGCIYLMRNDQLIKFNPKGDSIAAFNDVYQYGKPSYIDVTNPLKNLVLYQSYGIITTLDRSLNSRNNISLKSVQLLQVNAAAVSYDNQIWVFDEQNFVIKKIDDSGNTLMSSADVRVLTSDAPTATAIFDHQQQLYLYDENKGIYIFDLYGGYKKMIAIPNWKGISIYNNAVFGMHNGQFLRIDLVTQNEESIALPRSNQPIISVSIANRNCYVFTSEGLVIYQLD